VKHAAAEMGKRQGDELMREVQNGVIVGGSVGSTKGFVIGLADEKTCQPEHRLR